MEDFVTFEIAKKLKEKGFKYNKMNLLDRICMENQINHPPIAQVLKWLREENEIYINIVSYFSYAPKNNVAFAFCARYKEGDDWRDVEINESYLTYEECALSSIEYVLDNLI